MVRLKSLPDGPHLTTGEIDLRPPRREELPLYARWWADPVVCYGFCSEPRSLDELRQAFPEAEDDARGYGHWMEFVIEVQGRPAGLIWLSHHDLETGTCLMGILIGESRHRLRGIGRQAIRLLAGWAFEMLGLRRIDLIVRDDLVPAIRCYEAAGARLSEIETHVSLWEGEVVLLRRMSLRPNGPTPADGQAE